MKRLVLLAGAFLLLSQNAQAEQRLRNIQVTPFAGFTFGGDIKVEDEADPDQQQTFSLDESANFGVALNWPSRYPTEWEVYFNHQDTKLKDSGAKLSIDTLQLGGTYLGTLSTAMPYFVATAGATRIAPKNTSADYFFGFSVGGGWKFFPTKRIGLRLEGRALGTVISSNSSWVCGVNGGGACAIRTSGNMLWQFQANAGVVFRF